jgi:hypothetical protein
MYRSSCRKCWNSGTRLAARHRNRPTASLDEIRLTAGNEQLLALYNRRDELGSSIDSWTDLAERITKRWPNWTILKRLMAHASGLQDAEVILAQVKTIEQQRQLLEDPDLVALLITNLTQLLCDELNKLDDEYASRHAEGLKRLADDSNWQQLEPEQRYQLMSAQFLHESARPVVAVQTTSDVLTTLDKLRPVDVCRPRGGHARPLR